MKHENESSASEKNLTVSEEDSGRRIDIFLAERIKDLSRNRIHKLLETEHVYLDCSICKDKNYRLQKGETVKVIIPAPEQSSLQPEPIELDIVFEDHDLLVINKPRGMVVHPAPGHSGGTLVNALLSHCTDLSGIGGVMRPGIVHRLDKDTSGLLIVAKNDITHRALSAQLKQRKLKRIYIALCYGRAKPSAGRIEAPVGRHPVHRKKMAVIDGGREAITRYRVLRYYNELTLLKLKLETGRTHQIRVHLSYIGYPVVGDPLYAKTKQTNLPSELAFAQALHAYRLIFVHPRSKELLNLSAPLPQDFKAALQYLYISEKNASCDFKPG